MRGDLTLDGRPASFFTGSSECHQPALPPKHGEECREEKLPALDVAEKNFAQRGIRNVGQRVRVLLGDHERSVADREREKFLRRDEPLTEYLRLRVGQAPGSSAKLRHPAVGARQPGSSSYTGSACLRWEMLAIG